MSIQAQLVQQGDSINFTADAAYSAGAVIQMFDGRCGVVVNDVASGAIGSAYVTGVYKFVKTASMVLLHGGRAYWDDSASAVYYRRIDDKDFYIGRLTADAASADTVCYVQINVDPKDDISWKTDPGLSVLVGTAAAGAFGRGIGWKGECMNLLLTATSEAQKVDWLSKDGFSINANAIVEFAFSVPTGSAAGGNQDLNIGVANGTHASDADSITKHLFMHFDGNATKLNFQSKDGTTTVAATDSTTTLTAGATNGETIRKEVWLDLRSPAACLVYVNSVAVLTSTVFDISAWSTTTVQLLAHLEKSSSTDTAEVDIDFFRARTMKMN